MNKRDKTVKIKNVCLFIYLFHLVNISFHCYKEKKKNHHPENEQFY
jgi:hypothetical protein